MSLAYTNIFDRLLITVMITYHRLFFPGKIDFYQEVLIPSCYYVSFDWIACRGMRSSWEYKWPS